MSQKSSVMQLPQFVPKALTSDRPVDARLNRRRQWVSNATITDTLKGLEAKHVMVVADSCYSGTLIRGTDQLRVRTEEY